MIVDVEATRAIRQAEVGAARTMLERTEERFGLKPDYLVADTAYGSADNLAWLVKQKQITPHIPVFDKSARTDGTFSRSDFTFDPEARPFSVTDGPDGRARRDSIRHLPKKTPLPNRKWSRYFVGGLPHNRALGRAFSVAFRGAISTNTHGALSPDL